MQSLVCGRGSEHAAAVSLGALLLVIGVEASTALEVTRRTVPFGVLRSERKQGAVEVLDRPSRAL